MPSDRWREANADKIRAYRREWYACNAEAAKEQVIARRRSLIAWLREYKSARRCEWCGYDGHPSALSFHHKDATQKELNLSVAVRHGWSFERLHAEIAKCELVCANCHERYHCQQNRSRRQQTSQSRQRRREYALQEWFDSVKAQYDCLFCGQSDPDCLHFHHRNPVDKVKAVANMVQDGWGQQAILDEIAKCDVLCANCHLALHQSDDGES